MIVYVDTSALGRVYLGDQSDSMELSHAIYADHIPVVTSELTDVEITSTIARAERAGTIGQAAAKNLLARYDAETSDSGPLGVIPLDHETLALARRFLCAAPLRTLDAIHLAACVRFSDQAADEVRLLSRDDRQNEAAGILGIPVLAA